MSSPAIFSNPPSIQRWEEAGTALADALGTYLGLCVSLEKTSLGEGMRPRNLVTCIDNALDSLHITLDRQIAQARSVLSKTRNEILSPFTALPQEVLAEIFAYVIFSHRSSHEAVPLKQSVILIYRSLNTLAGVCSVWRNIVLVQGRFWSIVPALASSLSTAELAKATRLSIERSGSCDLHLAIVASLETDFDIGILELERYAARFRIITILSESRGLMTSIMNNLLKSNPPIQPLELSLCEKQSQSFFRSLPVEGDYIYPLGFRPIHRYQRLFYDLLESLSVLRVCGAHIHWDMLAFSSRLTKLRLQELNFGFDRTMIDHLGKALSSAAGLRELEIISIRTFEEGFDDGFDDDSDKDFDGRHIVNNQTISLPQLQILLIQDLYYNTLMALLGFITPGSHHLTLHLTDKYELNHGLERDMPQAPIFKDMLELLKRVPVHTLRIDIDEGARESYLPPWMLRQLLESMPALENFLSCGGDFDKAYWNAFERPQPHESDELVFPHLVNIHFGEVGIWTTKTEMQALQRMVTSHSSSLRRMVLGGFIWNTDGKSGDLTDDEEIITWLKKNVRGFQLRDSYTPREFQQAHWEWRLW